MGVQRAINGQLITWEVIVYGFLGMEQVAARYKDPWKAAVYCCEHNCAEVKMALSEPDDSVTDKRLTAAAAAFSQCRGQPYKADFKTLFTFYKLSGIMKGEPHEEAGQWNNDMIRKPDFP